MCFYYSASTFKLIAALLDLGKILISMQVMGSYDKELREMTYSNIPHKFGILVEIFL